MVTKYTFTPADPSQCKFDSLDAVCWWCLAGVPSPYHACPHLDLIFYILKKSNLKFMFNRRQSQWFSLARVLQEHVGNRQCHQKHDFEAGSAVPGGRQEPPTLHPVPSIQRQHRSNRSGQGVWNDHWSMASKERWVDWRFIAECWKQCRGGFLYFMRCARKQQD